MTGIQLVIPGLEVITAPIPGIRRYLADLDAAHRRTRRHGA